MDRGHAVDWTIQDLGALGEFVGAIAIAVFVTLFYLAIQVRHSKQATEANTRSLRASASWDSELTFAHRNEKIARDPEFGVLLQRAFETDGDVNSFDASERAQFLMDTLNTIQMVQAQYFMWKEGVLPDQIGEYRSVWARRYVMLPVIGAFWQEFRSTRLNPAIAPRTRSLSTVLGSRRFARASAG